MYNRVLLQLKFKKIDELLNTSKIGELIPKLSEDFNENKIVSGVTLFINSTNKQYLAIEDQSIQLTVSNIESLSDFSKTLFKCLSTIGDVFDFKPSPISTSIAVLYSCTSGSRIVTKLISVPNGLKELASDVKTNAIGLDISQDDMNYTVFLSAKKRGLEVLIANDYEVENKNKLNDYFDRVCSAIEMKFIPKIDTLLKTKEVS